MAGLRARAGTFEVEGGEPATKPSLAKATSRAALLEVRQGGQGDWSRVLAASPQRGRRPSNLSAHGG